MSTNNNNSQTTSAPPAAAASSSSIPQNWNEAEQNVTQLVSALISAASAYGVSTSAVGRILPHSSSSNSNNNINYQQEIPSPHETIGFMKAACNVIHQLWPENNNNNQSNSNDENNNNNSTINDDFAIQAVQHVLFDASHELLSVLWMFVVPPRNPWVAATAAQIQQDHGDNNSNSSSDIKASAFRAIKSVALLCARDPQGLAFMFKDIVIGERGITSITRCLCSAASTGESRCAAAELLLVLALQLGMTDVSLNKNNNNQHISGGSQHQGADVIDVGLLVSTTLAEPDSSVRSFILATVQGCISAATTISAGDNNKRDDPLASITALCSPSIISSLLRLISADDTRDVRCVATLCAQALMAAIPLVMMNSSVGRKRNNNNNNNNNNNHILSLAPSDYLSVAETAMGRLFALVSPVSISLDIGRDVSSFSSQQKQDSSFEAIEEEIVSLIQLLESVTIAAASVGNEQVFVALRQRNIAKTLLLRMNQGNGKLSTSPTIVSSVVKCIRIMLELSPPFASQCTQLVDSTTLTAVFKLVLSLPPTSSSRNNNNHEDELLALAAIEIQLILGIIFSFSADTRSAAVSELSNKSMYAFSSVLRDRCSSHISLKAIERFYQSTILGMELRDEHHALLNDETLSQLRFTPAGDSIDEESARMILDGQQLRALPSSSGSPSPSSSSYLQQRQSSSNNNNRIEVTEHWRACASPRLLNLILISQQNNTQFLSQSAISVLQHRAAIMIGLIRHVVQSVLQTVCDLSESQKKTQEQYLGGDQNNSMNNSALTTSLGIYGTPTSGMSYGGMNNNDVTFQNDNNNNSMNTTTSDPNEKFITDNSPFVENQEYNNNNNNSSLLKSQAAKRFLQGNADLSTHYNNNNNTSNNNNNNSASRMKQQQQQAEKILTQVNNSLYSEFDACLRLVLAFSEHYTEEEVSTSSLSKPGFTRDAKNPHLLIRKTKQQLQQEKSKLKNPWAAKRLQYNDTKAWTVDAVHEGDLFYFSVQVVSLNANVLDAIVAKARSHYLEIKKHLAVTPTTIPNRRHFLSEMVNSIMPNAIALLQKFQKIVAAQGEGHVQTALALCPELNIGNNNNRQSSASPFVDCGNVVPVVEFLLSYFSTKLYSMGLSGGNNNQQQRSNTNNNNANAMMMRSSSNDHSSSNNNNNNDNYNNNNGSSTGQQQSVDQILASLGGGNNNRRGTGGGSSLGRDVERETNNVFDDF